MSVLCPHKHRRERKWGVCVYVWKMDRAQGKRASFEGLLFPWFLFRALNRPISALRVLFGPLVPMGIIKIRRQGPKKDDDPLHSSLGSDDEFAEEEGVIAAKVHGHEHDNFELSDTGCEHALVNGQICNVPYELYEITNLDEILSLETWNSSLTEEERFHLAAYLPDMDRETFLLTMPELLGGANIFFGSPLEILFSRLKGGFYSLQASHYRERLKFLYERRYYHSLRYYHERMGQKIADMRKAWSNCKPDSSVEERVQILYDKRNRKPVFLVDLNAFPADEDLSSKAEKKIQPRYLTEEIGSHVPIMDCNGMDLNSGKKAKGVLKVKPLEMNPSKHICLQFHKECREEPLRRPPKGVLKIKPKGYLNSLVERPMVISVLRDQSSSTVFANLSPSDFDSQWKEETLDRRLTPELANGRQSENALSIGSGLSADAHSFLKGKTTVKSMKMRSNGASAFGEFFDLYQPVPANYRRKMMPVLTDVTEAASRSHIFPITFKRKKSRRNLGALQTLKQPSMLASMEPGFDQLERSKSIKMGVRGWNEFTS